MEVVDGLNKKSFGGTVGKKPDESGCVKEWAQGHWRQGEKWSISWNRDVGSRELLK